ncbi:unnamed protein product [Linum tenue]|uniref:Uncharacterized protein n=1 Tax=Linum tenue TaxID=586396 RepID=A0AAV0J6M5_9ROSI|nr:unnamed protein product [Linum tenue]
MLHRWHAFRGDSTDPKDLIFSTKSHSLLAFKAEIDVFLAASATAEKACDFKVKGSFSGGSCVVYAGKEEKAGSVVARMHKKHTAKSVLLGKDHFAVTVNPNVDMAFVVALVVLLDHMNRQGGQAGGAPIG